MMKAISPLLNKLTRPMKVKHQAHQGRGDLGPPSIWQGRGQKRICFQEFLKMLVKLSSYLSGMPAQVSNVNVVGRSMLIFVTDRWYAGCFVWNQSAVPVFTVDPEIAYLSAFTNSMMVEISRLEAITANKMKSDFISSISRMCTAPSSILELTNCR